MIFHVIASSSGKAAAIPNKAVYFEVLMSQTNVLYQYLFRGVSFAAAWTRALVLFLIQVRIGFVPEHQFFMRKSLPTSRLITSYCPSGMNQLRVLIQHGLVVESVATNAAHVLLPAAFSMIDFYMLLKEALLRETLFALITRKIFYILVLCHYVRVQ